MVDTEILCQFIMNIEDGKFFTHGEVSAIKSEYAYFLCPILILTVMHVVIAKNTNYHLLT